MAAAGAGRLTIVDMDRVERHNLNRQILHTTDDIDRFKTASALQKLKALTPACHIDTRTARITGDTAADMVHGCDLILLNDLPQRVPANSDLVTLTRNLGEADPDLIVELNGRFVYPRDYATTVVQHGDRLEFINPNFGG
jgi:thiamine biosynthesis protein ThiS